jgi:preprotein translocase subunit SecG
MTTFLTVLHVFVCVFLILVVLLQAGKGGGMGIAFGGGGGSQTVFGSSGAGNFLTKLTSVTAFIFLVTSLGLAHYSSQQDSKRLQRLAERKSEEKKVEDERAGKLKADLDKAREAAKKMGSGDTAAPKASELPPGAAGATPGKLELKAPAVLGGKAEKPEPAAKSEKAEKAEKPAKAAKAAAGEAAPADGAAPAPVKKKKRRAAPPAEGEGAAAPAAPAAPAEAPAAPAPAQ